MPGSTPSGLPYPLPTEPVSAGAAAIRDLAEAVAPAIPLVSALPSSPHDGAVVDYLVDPAGIFWRFRYRASSPSVHKWECVGGGHLHMPQTADQTLNNLAYQPATGIGTLTLPLAGDYDVSLWCTIYYVGSSAFAGWATIKVGAAAAGDALAAIFQSPNPGGATSMASVGREMRLTDLAAGTVLAMNHKTNGGVGVGFGGRSFRVIPLRVH
jgi:hypothetical protein